MTKIELEIHDDVIACMNKIKELNDAGIELDIPEGSVLFDNILNLKLLKKEAERFQKTLHFRTVDDIGLGLLAMMEEEQNPMNLSDFAETAGVSKAVGNTLKAPKAFALPKIKLLQIQGPKMNAKVLGCGLMLLLTAGLGGFFLLSTPKAWVKVVVNSQPLTKSLTIRVVKDAEPNAENKVLKGYINMISESDVLSGATTGQALTGKKASGSATIYNKTDKSKELKKGTILTYRKDKSALNFLLEQNVTVAAETTLPVDPNNPGQQIVKFGEVTANMTAEDIGDRYNVDSGVDFELKGFSKDDYTAKGKDTFKGGSSKTVSAVAAADKTKLSQELYKTLTEKIQTSLEMRGGTTQKYIAGSAKFTKDQETFSKDIGQIADNLDVTQSLTGRSLYYSALELDRFLDKLVESLIPQDYEISSKEREVKVEVLGNTSETVLTDTQADIQVTLKTYIVPKISADKIKSDLRGKNLSEAQKYLGSVQNVKTYELNVSPNIPFLNKIPNDMEKIKVEVVRN